jgi:lipopolysaccharide/colanic/teichoic acid biosynthesis glycosyltransferase
MTANTRSISGKAAKALRKRQLSLTPSQRRQKRFWLQALDGTAAKRAFDIVFSLLVLTVFSPLYLILAVAIAVSSPGPIFYVQERVGKNYRRFRCLKFRTMVNDADEMLASIMAESPQMQSEFADNFKLKDDPRITPIGKFLRLTSLDEFPQFWNVLKGDMSVVGPRPLVPEELQKYGDRMERVLSIRPGITGLWQVSGRNDIPYPQRVQIDAYYVSARSWLLDLWIIVKTIGVIIFTNDNGAY